MPTFKADVPKTVGPVCPADPAAVAARALVADPSALRRMVFSIVAEELGRLRGRAATSREWSEWTLETRLTEDDLGIDSLGRLEIVSRLDQAFGLSATGVEDYLFVEPRLGDWLRLIALAIDGARRSEPIALTFQTSGSTGAPKAARHALSDLVAEIDAHAAALPRPRRIVALVPPQHIYGFLWTVLAPSMWSVPTVDLRGAAPGAVVRQTEPGDLIVATPFLWDLMIRSGGRFAADVTGLTSSAPAPPSLWPETAAAGLLRLVEVYGSSETGGLGSRDAADAPFRLLAHLRPGGWGGVLRAGAPLAVQDRLEWDGPDTFHVRGRIDGAAQVGGVNVYPERVRRHAMTHPDVADCTVRLSGTGPTARLKAFVVPRPDTGDTEPLLASLTKHFLAGLSAPERPASVTFGATLPVSTMGKAADWD